MRYRKRFVLLVVVLAALAGWTVHRRGSNATPVAASSSAENVAGSGRSAARVSDGIRIEIPTIDGRVVDEANAPLAGVNVCALTPSPTCTISGANGTYAIANLAVADVRKLDVAAQLAHYSVVSVHDADTSTARHADTTVTMKSGAVALTGSVRDAGGGPIPRARVASSNSFTETDRDGAYTLWTSPEWASIEATADGYVTGSHGEQPPARLDFALLPEATISGRVLDATSGQAIPRAFVSVHTDASDISDGFAVADDDGRFNIDKLSPAIYSLRAGDPHARAIQNASLPIALGEHVDGVVVRVSSGFEVSGRVVIAPTGETCTSNPIVTLVTGHDVGTTCSADDTGIVHVPALAPGTYRVEVSCDHHRSNDHYDDVVVVDRDVTDRVWTVTAGATVTGRVLDQHGAPIPKVYVYADEIAPSDPNHRSTDNAQTEADGSFTLGGLRSGNHQLSVGRSHGGTLDSDNVVVALSSDSVTHHDFVIDNTTSELVGHVRFADGSPARGVDVKLTPAGSDSTIGTSTDDNGRFSFTDVHGDYRAMVFMNETPLPLVGADATGILVHVAPSSTNRLELTTTATTGEIHGHVVDDHGQPVDDAFVSIAPYDASSPDSNYTAVSEVFVGTDGSFRAGDLLPGSYRARAYRRSGGDAIVAPVELGSNVTLTLATTGAVTGVARLDGAPLQQFALSLDDPTSPRATLTLDVVAPDGQFTLDGVAPGHYRLSATADVGAALVELDVGAGQTVTVDIDIEHAAHLRGRVVDATGQPLPGARVLPSGTFSSDGFTDANGQFDVLAAPRGPMSVWILTSDSPLRNSWDGRASKEIVVDADTVDVGDITVPGQE